MTNIAELEALLKAITGIWQVGKNKATGRVQVHNGRHQVCAVWHTNANPAVEVAECIAALHNAAPALLAELKRLREEVAALRERAK